MLALKVIQTSRMDIVCDNYYQNSLKGQTRKDRGLGQALELDSSTICSDFKDFLRNDDKKIHLIQFLTSKIMKFMDRKVKLFISVGDEILTNVDSDVSILDKIKYQEEADTKIVPHVFHCLKNGFTSIDVHTVDTDVIILLLAFFKRFRENGLVNLQVTFEEMAVLFDSRHV